MTLLQSVVSFLLDYELEMMCKYLMINIIFVYTPVVARLASPLCKYINPHNTPRS
jgi:hypothetical protein